jgi:hypothetical protein
MKWHGTIAHYSKKHNGVAERRVMNFSTYQKAEQWISGLSDDNYQEHMTYSAY